MKNHSTFVKISLISRKSLILTRHLALKWTKLISFIVKNTVRCCFFLSTHKCDTPIIVHIVCVQHIVHFIEQQQWERDRIECERKKNEQCFRFRIGRYIRMHLESVKWNARWHQAASDLYLHIHTHSLCHRIEHTYAALN